MATTAKSPVGATSPRVGHDRGSGAPSYFPQQQQYHEGLADAETLSNTLANAHIAQAQLDNNTHLAAPVATRPNGRFTEEWDASQRGSSIVVDGVSPVNNMHRTSSFAGSVIGDGSISLSRGNTLKKKASLRRAGSLKRSGSRRSMKAGSVRSLALQSSSADQDPSHSAFYCPVPTSGTPTEVLANRFQGTFFFPIVKAGRRVPRRYFALQKTENALGEVRCVLATIDGRSRMMLEEHDSLTDVL